MDLAGQFKYDPEELTLRGIFLSLQRSVLKGLWKVVRRKKKICLLLGKLGQSQHEKYAN